MRKYIVSAAMLFVVLAFKATAQKIDINKQPVGGPAPAINIATPASFTLPNGMTVFVVENHKLPKVSASLTIDAGPILEGNKAGVVELTGAMLNEGTTNKSKAQYDQAIDLLGAQVDLSAGGGSVASVTRYFDKAFSLFADGLKNPLFAKESFDKVKDQKLTGLKSSERSAKAISTRVVNALAYGIDNPMGEFETEQSIKSITLDDIKDSYKKFVTPSRSILTFVGDINVAKAKALVQQYFSTWKGATLTLPMVPLVNNPAKTEINVIDVPNASQTEITVTNLVNLPLGDPDYFPALLANQILGGGAEGRLFLNLREKHGFTYGSYSSVGTGRFQSKFSAAASVRAEKVDSAVREILNEVKRLRTEPVGENDLQSAKNLYSGTFAMSMENPATVGNFAKNILLNQLPADFYKNFLKKINAVSLADVQRVAQKYFSIDNSRIITVGKAAQFADALKKLGPEVKFFDKYAKPATEPGVETVVAAPGLEILTGKSIVDNYLKAIGGASELSKVTSMLQQAEIEMQGMVLNVVQEKMLPNKSLSQVSMQGNVVQKEVFDGEAGYKMAMGQKKPLTEADVKDKKTETIIDQMAYSQPGYTITLVGSEKVQGSDAFKLVITTPGGQKITEFYDVNTNLLLKQVTVQKESGVDITTEVLFSDYKKVGAILFPHTVDLTMQSPMGEQSFTSKVKDIKINQGVKVEDFK